MMGYIRYGDIYVCRQVKSVKELVEEAKQIATPTAVRTPGTKRENARRGRTKLLAG